MKIRYSLTADDFVAIHRWHCLNSSIVQRARWANALIGAALVLGIVIGIPIVFPPNQPEDLSITAHAVICVLAVGLFLVFHNRSFHRNLELQARQQVQEAGGQGFLGEHELEIDAESLIERTAEGESRFSWSEVQEITASKDYIFVNLTKSGGQAVPRNRLVEGNADEFLQRAKTFLAVAFQESSGDCS